MFKVPTPSHRFLFISLIALCACAPTAQAPASNAQAPAAQAPASNAQASQKLDLSYLQGLHNTRYHRVDFAPLDQTYHVFVRLPEEYRGSTEAFPTVYLLDGGTTFPLLSGYYRYLRFAEAIPPMIIVGISYGADDPKQGNMRSRDFTAPTPEREYWGGARTFQEFFRESLFPLIERNYRSDPDRRIVFGQSLGGQFAIHAALFAPDVFWGHIASNPALHRNLDVFVDRTKVVTGDRRVRLYVSSGSEDARRFREPALAWMDYWRASEQRPFDVELQTLPGETHFSAAPAAFRAGMRWLFATPDAAGAATTP